MDFVLEKNKSNDFKLPYMEWNILMNTVRYWDRKPPSEKQAHHLLQTLKHLRDEGFKE